MEVLHLYRCSTHTLLNGFLPLLSTWVDQLSAAGFREAGNGEPAKVAELPRRRQWRTLDRSVLRHSTIDLSHVPSRSTFRSGCDVWEVLWAWISENGFVRKFWMHKIISSSQVTFGLSTGGCLPNCQWIFSQVRTRAVALTPTASYWASYWSGHLPLSLRAVLSLLIRWFFSLLKFAQFFASDVFRA